MPFTLYVCESSKLKVKLKQLSMKKVLLSIALVFGLAGANAQDLTSKKGEPILPESGDWAIAIEANPFLTYFGGFLSNGGATSPTFNWMDSGTMTIMGKMFKDEKTAYRAMLRVGFGSSKQTGMVADVTVTTPPTFPAIVPQVEDTKKSTSNAIGLGAGMEMRRGKTRLQGYYGADALIWMSGSKRTYEYGNAMNTTTATNAQAISYNFSDNYVNDASAAQNPARVLEAKSGTTFGVGVRGFIGAEYFIFPKISIGGEYGWGLGITSSGTSSVTTESYDAGANAIGEITTEAKNGSGFSIDTDINRWWSPTGSLGGNLFMILHF